MWAIVLYGEREYELMRAVILHLAQANPAKANPLVEQLLRRQPNNIIALAAQVSLVCWTHIQANPLGTTAIRSSAIRGGFPDIPEITTSRS
jgi:hypothetical protein